MIKFLILFCFSLFYGQDVELTSYVKNKDINTNDMFDYFIELRWQGSSSDFTIESKNFPQLDGLEMHGSGASNKVLNENNIQISKKIITYKLKAQRSGQVRIAPFSVNIINNKTNDQYTLSTQQLILNIKEYIPPTEIDDKILYSIIGFIFIVIFLIVFIFWKAKKKKSELEDYADLSEKYHETIILNKCKNIKNEVERVELTTKQLLNLFEEYSNHESVNKNKLIPDGDSSNDNSTFLEKMNELRYSGEIPNTIDLDLYINEFINVLKQNLEIRKNWR